MCEYPKLFGLEEIYDPDSLAQSYVDTAAIGKSRSNAICNLVVILLFQIALVVYDTLLTLHYEIKYIWMKKFRLGSVLYLLARYSVIINLMIPSVFNSLPNTALWVSSSTPWIANGSH